MASSLANALGVPSTHSPLVVSSPIIVSIPAGPSNPLECLPPTTAAYRTPLDPAAWSAQATSLIDEFTEEREPDSHASRHPLVPILPARVRNGVKKGPAKSSEARAGDTILRGLSKKVSSRQALEDSCWEGVQDFELLIVSIAATHKVGVEVVRRLMFNPLTASSHTRPVTLWNAKVAHKAVEMQGSSALQHLTPAERLLKIQDATRADEDLNAMEEGGSEAEGLKQVLRDRRVTKTIGIRGSNKAAAPDYAGTIRRVEAELRGAFTRLGVRAIVMFVKGNRSDPGTPECIATGGAEEFSIQIMKKTLNDLTALFEYWSIARSNQLVTTPKKTDLAQEVVRLLQSALNTISGFANAVVNYSDPAANITKYGLELEGWPLDVRRLRPSQLNVAELRILIDAVRQMTCQWVKLSDAMVLEARRSATKVRKPRADKGKKRKRQAAGGEDDDEPAPKRTKKAAVTKKAAPKTKKKTSNKRKQTMATATSYTSAAFIDDSDDEDEMGARGQAARENEETTSDEESGSDDSE